MLVNGLEIDVNINDNVLVKLNDKGFKILEDQHEALRELFLNVGEFVPPKTDSDGYCKFQLWELMQTFGPHIRLSEQPPFDTEIKICRT